MRPRGGCRSLLWSVCDTQKLVTRFQLTLQVEEHVGLIVLEHLGNKLDVHVVDIDLLFDVLDQSLIVSIFLQV